jgi:hypothetical protein
MTYDDDIDNLYFGEDFDTDGSSKGFNGEDDSDPYVNQFGFSIKDGDDDADVETEATLPIEDDEPLIDEDLAGLAGEKEEEEAE